MFCRSGSRPGDNAYNGKATARSESPSTSSDTSSSSSSSSSARDSKSPAPDSATAPAAAPTPQAPAEKRKGPAYIPGTFEYTLRREHISLGRLLRAYIRNDTRDENELPKAVRLRDLQDIRDEYLTKQKQCGTITVKSKFPDKFDQAGENHWLARWVWKEFPTYLAVDRKSKGKAETPYAAQTGSLARGDVDQDDEEVPPPLQVKTEKVEDDELPPAGEKVDSKKAPPAPIQDSKTSDFLPEDTVVESNNEGQIKRMWKFVNGKCIVWPPFDGPLGPTVAEVESSSNKVKREHGDDSEGAEAATKKRRFW